MAIPIVVLGEKNVLNESDPSSVVVGWPLPSDMPDTGIARLVHKNVILYFLHTGTKLWGRTIFPKFIAIKNEDEVAK